MPEVKLQWDGDQLTPEAETESPYSVKSGDYSANYQLTRQLVHEYSQPIVQDYIAAASAAQQAAAEAQATEAEKFKKEQSTKQTEGKAAESSFAETMVTGLQARKGQAAAAKGELQPAHGEAPKPELQPAHTPYPEKSAVAAETGGLEQPMIDPTQAGAAGAGAVFSLSRSAGMALMPSLARAASAGIVNMAADPVYGTAAEVVGVKAPELALPFNIAAGVLGGMTLEPAIERGIRRALQSAGRTLNPAQLAEQVQMMKGILANEAGMVEVWHGSPHKFDKMDISKIGTGEGSQAFGHGLYFTDKKEIASHYSRPKHPYGAQINESNIDSLKRYLQEGKTEDAQELALSMNRISQRAGQHNEARAWTEIYYSLLKGKLPDWAENSAVYRAQLFPGKDPSEYTFLDWYEQPSKNQINKIFNSLKKQGIDIKSIKNKLDIEPYTLEDYAKEYGRMDSEVKSMYEAYIKDFEKGEAFSNRPFGTFNKIPDTASIYDELSRVLGSQREASLFLKRAGIDGIRYPTETLSGKGPKGGEGFNYVVFDDKDIRLVSRESGGQVEPINYKGQLLNERQGMIDRIGAIKADYDRMIAESNKILGVDHNITRQAVVEEINAEVKKLSVGDILKSQRGEVVIRQGAAPPDIKTKVKAAYEDAKATSGGSSVDIAILRDNLGLSQAKMAALLRKASQAGDVVMALGEPANASDFIKGGMVDGNLLVRLDDTFFDNIDKYLTPAKKKIAPAAVSEGESGIPKPPDMEKAGQEFLAQPRPDITTDYAGAGNQRLWGAALDPKTPEELMGTLVSGQNVFQAQSDEARRYVQGWKAGEAKAQKYHLEDMLGRRLGQAFNQEQIINAQDNFVNILGDFKAKADVIKRGGATDIDKADFMASLNLFYSGLMQMSGVAAEAGRALQVFRRMKTMGNMKLGELQEFMKGVSNLPVEKIADAISQAESPAEVAGLIRASKKATSWNMFKEAWVNLLIGPYSQLANFCGNTVSSLWGVGEHGLASIISQSPIGSKEIRLGEGVAAAYGWVEGWKDGIKLFGKAWMRGQSQFEGGLKVETGHYQPAITAENIKGVLAGEEGSRNWVQQLINKNAPHLLEEGGGFAKAADFMGEAVRAGFGFGGTRTLTACDDLFKSVAYRSELRALSLRKAFGDINTVETAETYLKNIGIKTADMDEKKMVSTAIGHRQAEILTDPQTHAPELSMEAMKAADYATFTNELNSAGQAALNLLQKAPPLQLITPFFKTPWNVNKWAMTRMPIIGQLFPSFWQDMAAGGAKRDMAMARVSMGAALAGVTGYLAYNGYVTGGGPTAKDKKLRSSLYNTNWKPYSITFDGETYHPYKYGFEPLATMIGWTADAVDILKSTRSDDPEVQNSLESIAAAVSLGWAKNAMNTTFLSGPARLIEAVDDPDRYGKAWVRGFAGSFMPGAARDIEKLWSPEKKDIQGIMDLYKSKIPGYSEELPRMRNRWGDVIKVDNRFLSNETQTSPIDNELIRIRGDLPKPRREQVFEINGRRASMPVELTPHQYEDLIITMNKVELQSTGEPVKKTLSEIIKEPDYKNKTPDEQIHKLRGYWNEASRLARREILEKYPDIMQRVEADLAAQQAAKQ